MWKSHGASTVIREGGQIVSTPQHEKLRTRRKGNGSRVHQGIARHPGLVVRVHGPSLFSVSSFDAPFLLLGRMHSIRERDRELQQQSTQILLDPGVATRLD